MSSVRKIALQAGCSSSTVSLVLRGDPSISKATADRVMDVAKKLGHKYVPKTNSAATDSNQRHFLLVTGALNTYPIGAYFAVIDGISDACREFGVRFSMRQLKTVDCLDALSSVPCDGIIYGMADSEIEKQLIAQIKKPMLKVMNTLSMDWPYDHVTYNNPMVGRLVGNYLIKEGHRKVVFISFDNDIFNGRIREARAIIEQNGGTTDTLLLPPNSSTYKNDELIGNFFAGLRTNNVTAIFSLDDFCAVSIYQLLLHQGIRPGEDIKVISCNNETVLEQLHPRPPSVDIHARSVGRMAVRQMLWRLDNPAEPVITVQLSPTLPGISLI